MATPDYLAVGHVTSDVTPEGHALGGAVVFGAITAARMGLSPAIVTSAGPDFDPDAALPGIPVQVVPAEATTTFENVYSDGVRTQHIWAVAAPIVPADIPDDWGRAPMVFLGPVARELDNGAWRFPDAMVVASLQGWLRQWDATGLVTPKTWDGGSVLRHVDAAVVSEADLIDSGSVARWARSARALIVTRGRHGATLYHDGAEREVQAFAVSEADPTGAGDVFATAYAIRYRETGDPLQAAMFASCAASFAVEAHGVAGIPTRGQVDSRLTAQA